MSIPYDVYRVYWSPASEVTSSACRLRPLRAQVPSSLSVVQPTCQPGHCRAAQTGKPVKAPSRHLQIPSKDRTYMGSLWIFSKDMIITLLQQAETMHFAIHLQPAAAQGQPPSSSRPGAFGGSRARSAMMPRHSHSSNPPASHQIPRTQLSGEWNRPTSTLLQV